MRLLRPVAVLLLCAASACTPGNYVSRDNTINVAATPGQEARVQSYAFWDTKTCTQNGTPQITVLNQPQHGTVAIRPGTSTISRVRDGGQTYCVGTTLPGTVVAYTPAAGFRGTDQFDYNITNPGQPSSRIPYLSHDTAVVTVR